MFQPHGLQGLGSGKTWLWWTAGKCACRYGRTFACPVTWCRYPFADVWAVTFYTSNIIFPTTWHDKCLKIWATAVTGIFVNRHYWSSYIRLLLPGIPANNQFNNIVKFKETIIRIVINSRGRWELFHQWLEDFAGSANLDFFFTAGVFATWAERTAKKPTEMATLKFPGRAFFLQVAVFYFPTWTNWYFSFLIGKQKIKLPLNMGRYRPPALLVTMYRLQGYSEELSQYFLCFSEFLSGLWKFSFIQRAPRVDDCF